MSSSNQSSSSSSTDSGSEEDVYEELDPNSPLRTQSISTSTLPVDDSSSINSIKKIPNDSIINGPALMSNTLPTLLDNDSEILQRDINNPVKRKNLLTTNSGKSTMMREDEHEQVLVIYASLLINILQSGIISDAEDKTLRLLRKKLNITKEEHLGLLEKKGWTQEKYERSISISSYVACLKPLVESSHPITKEDLHVLEENRNRLDLDESAHYEALAVLKITPQEWHRRIKQKFKNDAFGKSDAMIHVYDDDVNQDRKKEYCRGLFIFPRLHQWLQYDENTNEHVLWLDGRARTASSTELFYDLIFVAVIYQLTHLLAHDQHHWLSFVIMYTSIWRVWITNSGYSSRFDTDDLIHKTFYYLQMLGVVAMGLSVNQSFKENGSQAFSIAFIFAEAPIIIMYLWAFFVESKTRTSLINSFIITISLIPWIIATVLQENYFIYWGSGLIFSEIVTPLLSFLVVKYPKLLCIKSYHYYHAPIDVRHWAERLGLLVIIVLGESIVALLKDVDEEISVRLMVSAGLGLLIAFSLKWLYFDVQGLPKRQHALQRDIHYSELWTFIHWPLSMAMASTGAGILCLLEIQSKYEKTEIIDYNITSDISPSPEYINEFKESSQRLFCSSLAITIFCIALHGLLSKEHHQRIVPHWIRVVIRIIIAVIIAVAPLYGLNSIILLTVCAILCFSCVLWELIGTLPSKGEFDDDNEQNLTSIGNFIKNQRLGIPMNQSGTVAVNATMKDGTLVFNEERLPITLRKGMFV